MVKETATEWSLRTWKDRHVDGYFPNSVQHKGWKIYDEPPVQFMELFETEDFVLEIGCGYGEWMIPVSRMVTLVAGVDIHPTLRAKCVEACDALGVKNVSMFVNDGLTLPFMAESFDTIYSISVFQHIPRSMVRGYLKEAYRVAKPGCKVGFQFRSDRKTEHPDPAEDITVNHTGDFSVGWSVNDVLDACTEVGFLGSVTSHQLHSNNFIGRKS